MTATSVSVRVPPSRRAGLAPSLSLLRLLRIELRRSPMPLVLPLIALLFWFDSYRPSASVTPNLYPLVTFWNMGQGTTIVDFGPIVAGMAAWIGSRDGRRRTGDLVAVTVRPRWTAQLITWAAAALWAVAAYLAFTGIMFAIYAAHGVQGEPPWWWVAVGATAVAMFTAAGFTAGALIPTRFTAPLAAVGGIAVLMTSSQIGFRGVRGWALILPTNTGGDYPNYAGILYHYLPDLPIARIMFLAGIGVAVLGLLGWARRTDRAALRLGAALGTACGLAAVGTAVGLASTAHVTRHGVVIRALHDAANDQPVVYTPVCSGTSLRVCVNPAFKSDLPGLTAALTVMVNEVSGLPGVPVSTVQVIDQPMTITGNPPVLWVPLGTQPIDTTAADQTVWAMFVNTFTGAGSGGGTPAQMAVQVALLQAAGVPADTVPTLLTSGATPPSQAVFTAGGRLAAMSPAARHAWLAANIVALRAGHLTLAQVP